MPSVGQDQRAVRKVEAIKLYILNREKVNDSSRGLPPSPLCDSPRVLKTNISPSQKKGGNDIPGNLGQRGAGEQINTSDIYGMRVDMLPVSYSVNEIFKRITQEITNVRQILTTGGEQPLSGESKPVGPGVGITKLDYSRIRFREKIYNKKYYIFNDIIEEYTYTKIQTQKHTQTQNIRGSRGKEALTKEDLQTYLKRSEFRAKKEVRHLVNANADWFGKESLKFLTLTYAQEIYDIKASNRNFTNFIKRLTRFVGHEIKYVAVIEFQDKNRGGVIHYHLMLFNVPYIPNTDIERIWGHGFIKINAIDEVDNVGAYMVGYMGKTGGDERLYNEKRFFRSKGLKRPKEVVVLASPGNDFEAEGYREVYKVSYENKYIGEVTYRQLRKKDLTSMKKCVYNDRSKHENKNKNNFDD